MDETIKAIQTRDGPKQIDYNALANKPTIPSLAPYRTAAAQDVIDEGKIGTDMSVTATGLSAGAAPTVSYDVANNRLSFGIPKGDQGIQGIQGVPGADGADGHSPVVTATKVGTVTTVKVDGTAIATINDGSPGSPGAPGQDGADGITPTIGTNGNWYLGTTDTGKPSRGEQGEPGSDAEVTAENITTALGYTPADEEDIPDLSPYRTAAAQDVIDASKVSTADYNPDTKTAAMTQAVGKDAQGKLWTAPGGENIELLVPTFVLTEQSSAVYAYLPEGVNCRKIIAFVDQSDIEAGTSPGSGRPGIIGADHISVLGYTDYSSVVRLRYIIETNGGIVRSETFYSTNAENTYTLSYTPHVFTVDDRFKELGGIYWWACSFRVGTKITVWGVRT